MHKVLAVVGYISLEHLARSQRSVKTNNRSLELSVLVNFLQPGTPLHLLDCGSYACLR